MEAKPSSKGERLRALAEEFRQELPQRVAGIREAWDRLAAAPQSVVEAEGPLRRLAHNLAGTAGTFGYQALSDEARGLEQELVGLEGTFVGDLPADRLRAIQAHLSRMEALRDQIPPSEGARTEAPTEPPPPPKVPSPLIYVLEDDALLSQEIQIQLESYGYQVRCFASPEDLARTFPQEPPATLLADISFPEGSLEGARVVEALQRQGMGHIPVLFISAHTEWRAHLAALRAGGRGFLSKPFEYAHLVELLDQFTGRRPVAPLRILVMDDDPLLARHYAQVLEGAGMEVRILKQAEGVFEALSSFNPDLLLTDVYMPECTGIEAAAIIRQNPAYTHMPIVFLSGERSAGRQLEALRRGGDDFLEKPIPDAHLRAAIEIRARRFRALTALMQRDGLSGLLNHVNLKLALEREISQVRRRNSQLSVAMIDIDHFKRVNDAHGHPVGDGVIKSLSRLLTRQLRMGDLPARYGGEEFTVIFPDTGPETALKVMDHLREAFGKLLHRSPRGDFHATFSAGVASVPPHADGEAVLKAADAALYEAKRAGRNRVALGAPGPA